MSDRQTVREGFQRQPENDKVTLLIFVSNLVLLTFTSSDLLEIKLDVMPVVSALEKPAAVLLHMWSLLNATIMYATQ